VTWGVLHGLALVAERAGVAKWLGRLPVAVQRLYAMILVVSGWILFRSDSFAHAAGYFRTIFSLRGWMAFDRGQLDAIISAEGWVAIVVGVLAATPLLRWLSARLLVEPAGENVGWSARPAGTVVLLSLLVLSAMKLANGSFNPFIYYRF
jgi:alginate O-acetyltransferase complex protein AlgI